MFRYRQLKRFFDILLSLFLLTILSPIFIIAALLVRWKLGGPIFFKQRRPGRFGIPFEMIKFRTMTNACDAKGHLLPDSERLTRFGRFLRTTSLDELPELWNILKGEMSFVGPRPLLMEYLDRYTPEQARRHDVPPGLTGWAQINGRNAISWEEKFHYDLWYVEHASLRLDLKILLKTAQKVVLRESISQPGQATIQKFMG